MSSTNRNQKSKGPSRVVSTGVTNKLKKASNLDTAGKGATNFTTASNGGNASNLAKNNKVTSNKPIPPQHGKTTNKPTPLHQSQYKTLKDFFRAHGGGGATSSPLMGNNTVKQHHHHENHPPNQQTHYQQFNHHQHAHQHPHQNPNHHVQFSRNINPSPRITLLHPDSFILNHSSANSIKRYNKHTEAPLQISTSGDPALSTPDAQQYYYHHHHPHYQQPPPPGNNHVGSGREGVSNQIYHPSNSNEGAGNFQNSDAGEAKDDDFFGDHEKNVDYQGSSAQGIKEGKGKIGNNQLNGKVNTDSTIIAVEERKFVSVENNLNSGNTVTTKGGPKVQIVEPQSYLHHHQVDTASPAISTPISNIYPSWWGHEEFPASPTLQVDNNYVGLRREAPTPPTWAGTINRQGGVPSGSNGRVLIGGVSFPSPTTVSQLVGKPMSPGTVTLAGTSARVVGLGVLLQQQQQQQLQGGSPLRGSLVPSPSTSLASHSRPAGLKSGVEIHPFDIGQMYIQEWPKRMIDEITQTEFTNPTTSDREDDGGRPQGQEIGRPPLLPASRIPIPRGTYVSDNEGEEESSTQRGRKPYTEEGKGERQFLGRAGSSSAQGRNVAGSSGGGKKGGAVPPEGLVAKKPSERFTIKLEEAKKVYRNGTAVSANDNVNMQRKVAGKGGIKATYRVPRMTKEFQESFENVPPSPSHSYSHHAASHKTPGRSEKEESFTLELEEIIERNHPSPLITQEQNQEKGYTGRERGRGWNDQGSPVRQMRDSSSSKSPVKRDESTRGYSPIRSDVGSGFAPLPPSTIASVTGTGASPRSAYLPLDTTDDQDGREGEYSSFGLPPRTPLSQHPLQHLRNQAPQTLGRKDGVQQHESPFPEVQVPPVDGIFSIALNFLNGPIMDCLDLRIDVDGKGGGIANVGYGGKSLLNRDWEGIDEISISGRKDDSKSVVITDL